MEPQAKLDPQVALALHSLKDISAPLPVSWMPQTWGWLLVAIILVAACLLAGARAYYRWRRNAYRREALMLLQGIETAIGAADTRGRALDDLGELMKRTALAVWPRGEVAAASGADWVRFLAAHGETGTDEELRKFFDDLEYRGQDSVSGEVAGQLVRDARHWIEGHHVSA